MRLGVYVGSFDPVHKAHMEVVRYIIENNYVDKVIIIATGNYWDKLELTDIKKRIEMLKFYETEDIIVNTTLNNKLYTYEILDSLKEEYPNDELYLIVGADNIEKFHLWKEVEKILKNKILVFPRNGIDVDKYINNFKETEQFVVVKEFKPRFISSTQIRKLIKNKKHQNLDDFIDHFVLQYILQKDLY